jgi:heparan sulfate 2-O-sulfotransferase HS2ST1
LFLKTVNKYFLVGLTEDLESFVDILESTLPRFFSGAGTMFRSSSKWSHIRKTKHKDPISEQTIKKLQSTR